MKLVFLAVRIIFAIGIAPGTSGDGRSFPLRIQGEDARCFGHDCGCRDFTEQRQSSRSLANPCWIVFKVGIMEVRIGHQEDDRCTRRIP